ncbi:MAG TPA: type IV pilus secretin PilQ [Terriglobia bacterium]|nr:type IV pilus secretin PilQ [Terriglobia bacterium]
MRVDSGKFLSVGVLLLISTLAVNGAASKEAAIVKDVSFSNNGESLEVKIVATDESKYTHFELDHPHRLVVDFHGIQNTISFKEKKIDAAGLQRVRTSFFSDQSRNATRIVFDLTEDAMYRLIDEGGGNVRIVFGPAVHAPLNQVAGPPLALPLTVAAEPPQNAAPPAVPAATAAFPPPESPATSPPPATPAPAAGSASVAALESVVVRPPTQVTVVPQAPPQLPSTTPTPTPQYTGEIISLDLKDYDVKDFFRLISEISGLNVVLDPNVGGNVTLKLTDVPWDQALDVVLKNYQLGAQLQGNVLRIATNQTLQGEQTAQKALRDAQEQAAQLVTRTFLLNYTKADTVSATLRGLLSARGTIITDVRRNALIVTDIPTQYTNLESMVKFLDTPAQQVEIEARLLQANKSFSRDLGNQIGLLIGNRTGNILTGVPGTTSPFTRNPAPRAATRSGVPLVSNFPAAATAGLSFLIQPGGDILLDEIIGVSEARGTAKLISRPRVTTQNNVAATIQQGTQIPVQTNVNNTITVQFTSFTLNLTVTPQITEAGTILLQANITNSQPDFAKAVNGVPSVSTQSATTQVLIPDGGTAVIGGILIDTDSVNVRQVPGLGNLPLIGNLFKETNTAKSTSELLFFITPRIKPLDALSVLAPGEGQTPAQPQQR